MGLPLADTRNQFDRKLLSKRRQSQGIDTGTARAVRIVNTKKRKA
jgi:hypothetical protein